MNCVELRQVSLEVDGKLFLDQADLVVSAGESVVIAGLPGSGKSFVPRIILGLPGMDNDQVTLQGDVLVAGSSVPALSNQDLQALRRRIGTVMRNGGLIENRDIRTNIVLPLTYHYHDVLGPDDIQARCDAVLDDLLLAHLGTPGIRPVALTQQERRYASLARALVCEPFLLLLDEPCAGLSPGPANRLCRHVFSYEPGFAPSLPEHVGRHAGGLTRIVTTVDLGHYLDFADRFILLHDGSLTDLGDRANLLDSTDPRVRELLDGHLAATAPAAPPLAETLRG